MKTAEEWAAIYYNYTPTPGDINNQTLSKVIQQAMNEARDAALNECLTIGEILLNGFSSNEYEMGQPAASFGEKFACKQFISEISALKSQGETK